MPRSFPGTLPIAILESPGRIRSLVSFARAQSFAGYHARAVPKSLATSGPPHTRPGALSGARPGARSGARPGTIASTRTFPDQGSRRTAARPLAGAARPNSCAGANLRPGWTGADNRWQPAQAADRDR